MTFEEYRKQWLLHFAKGISEKKIKKYVLSTGNLIWHVFSWELLPQGTYLEGDEARKEYDNISSYEKDNAIFIDPFSEEDSFSLEWQKASANKLEDYAEIYVVSKDFSWTYIKTHEEDSCGPYFYRP